MNYKKILSPLALYLLSFSVNGNCIDANLVLINGKVYTGNLNQPIARTIAIKDQYIVYVDNKEYSHELICENPQILDLKGQYIFPGFTDAHGHLKGIGYRELTLNLQGINSLKETLTKVKHHIKDKKSGDWIIGRGWIDKVWPEKRFPNKFDLDEFSPLNPVVLERADGHAVVVNSLALGLANINSDTPNPHGGFIEKNKKGEPTGLLVDMAANLILDLIPKQ